MTMVMMNHKKFLKKKKFNTKLQHLIWNTQKKLISNEERKSNTRLMNRNRKFFFVSFRFVSFTQVKKSMKCEWTRTGLLMKKKSRATKKKDRLPNQKGYKDTIVHIRRTREEYPGFVCLFADDDDGKYCGWFDGSVIIITVIMLLPFANRIESNWITAYIILASKIKSAGGKKNVFLSFSKWKFDLVFVSLTHSYYMACVWREFYEQTKTKNWILS